MAGALALCLVRNRPITLISPLQDNGAASNNIMDGDVQNSNPTILSASDLPTRRRPSTTQKRADGGLGLFDSLLPAHGYPYDPFSPPSSTASSDVDAEDEADEPIDEQEIYDDLTKDANGNMITDRRALLHRTWGCTAVASLGF